MNNEINKNQSDSSLVDKAMRAFMASIRADREAECQRMEENVQISQCVAKMIADLRRKVRWLVPRKGDFKTVYTEFKNPDESVNVSTLRLKVSPVGTEGNETKRYLEYAVENSKSSYMCEIVITFGTKQDILDKLASEDLPRELLHTIPKLARDLED